jgi:hypothetical protein
MLTVRSRLSLAGLFLLWFRKVPLSHAKAHNVELFDGDAALLGCFERSTPAVAGIRAERRIALHDDLPHIARLYGLCRWCGADLRCL